MQNLKTESRRDGNTILNTTAEPETNATTEPSKKKRKEKKVHPGEIKTNVLLTSRQTNGAKQSFE